MMKKASTTRYLIQIIRSKLDGITAVKIDGYMCPRCNSNLGYLGKEKGETFYFCGDDDCMRKDRLAGKAVRKRNDNTHITSNESYFGPRYNDASFSKMEFSEQSQLRILNWINSPKNNLLYITSEDEQRKIFCSSMINYFRNMNRVAVYVNTRRYFESLKNAISSNRSEAEVIKRYASRDILIFDELGGGSCNEWQQEQLYDLLQLRWSNLRPTVLVTSHSNNDLTHILNDDILTYVCNDKNVFISE